MPRDEAARIRRTVEKLRSLYRQDLPLIYNRYTVAPFSLYLADVVAVIDFFSREPASSVYISLIHCYGLWVTAVAAMQYRARYRLLFLRFTFPSSIAGTLQR